MRELKHNMDKIVDFNAAQQNGFHCWMCHEGLNVRALFCNSCGCTQPPRDMDHFQRLGLERRIDVDLQQLERNATQLRRTFTPDRFTIRGLSEKNFAARHLEAVEQAYEVLRDPIPRSRYWIQLNSNELPEPKSVTGVIVTELQGMFDKAEGTCQLDRLAQRTGQEIEFGIMKLLSLLRQQDWDKANKLLTELDGLETLIVQVREKRQAITPPVK
jgi:molecular chaperone HscB